VADDEHVSALTNKHGDVVLYNPEECFEVEVQGDTYIILRERDLHAIASDRLDSGTGLYL
jgi:chaperonin GroES